MTAIPFDIGTTLFVDDAPTLLLMIRKTLQLLNYTAIETAESVTEALRILRTREIAHVVSDLRMPIQRGHEFLREVKAKHPAMRCTLLTGFESDLTKEDRDVLTREGITVRSKENLDIRTLARIVGVSANEDILAIDTPQEVGSINETSPADVIASQRLLIEKLLLEAIKKNELIRALAEDLIDELRSYGDLEKKTIIGSGQELSMQDLIDEIESGTPEGLRLIELDRAARRRVS